MLIGIDEAGMGTLAGPMVAAIVVLPDNAVLKGVKDSKKMTSEQREEAAARIMEASLEYIVTAFDAAEVDRIGISACWYQAVRSIAMAVHGKFPGEIVLDGNRLIGLPYVKPVVKADATHLAVSAASVLAKYTQVCAMLDLHQKYPRYGFNVHHGYGTAEHKKKLKELGPCPEHRKSFRPVRNLTRRSGSAPG